MERLKASLNLNQNIENKKNENSSSLLNLLKDEDERSSLEESFSISVKNDDEYLSKTSDHDDLKSNFLSSEFDEFLNLYKDEFPKDKVNIKSSQQIIGKKRSSTIFSTSKKIKNYSNPEISIKCKNKKDHKNSNTLSELEKCYNELENIMSKYSFLDIAKIILKINNKFFLKTLFS